MNIDPINLEKVRQKRASQLMEYDEEEPKRRDPDAKFRWRPVGRYRVPFQPHFAQIFIAPDQGYFLVGSNGNKLMSCLHYDGKTVKVLAAMPTEKTFFAFVLHKGKIWTFGGYDAYDKSQVSTCEYYDVAGNTWHNSPILNPMGKVEFRLHHERS